MPMKLERYYLHKARRFGQRQGSFEARAEIVSHVYLHPTTKCLVTQRDCERSFVLARTPIRLIHYLQP